MRMNWLAMGAMLASAAPVAAQVRTVDPNTAGTMAATSDYTPPPAAEREPPVASDRPEQGPGVPPRSDRDAAPPAGRGPTAEAAHEASVGGTYQENDVLSAAEGVFGKGAEGLAKVVEGIFKKQGRPNGYIVGREAGGAIIAGVRYGSGTLFHKVEGQRPVFWTGPSLGFDLGANGAKSFVLVYNLYDTQELFHRFPAAEGNVYVVGGFTASYLRRGNTVLVPIRLGVGWRLGANIGYMRFSEKARWAPF